ncbi:MAG: hypothetical protein ACF8SC_12900 [Phycisphaerales bacterium JB037]
MRRPLAFASLLAAAACSPAFAQMIDTAPTAKERFQGYTNNILLTGYWPPTNEMLRPWSPNPAQNPGGWQGGDWEGRGYDIFSYFPEYPNGFGQGEGDFEVDYQDTSADWQRIVNEIKPVAIITFSRANTSVGWELEGGNRMYSSSQWTSDYTAPTKPGAHLPIMRALAPGTELFSSLPMDDIIADVAASGINVDPFKTVIDTGRYLSNYIGLHGNWYHEQNNDELAEFRNFAAGHIHVGLNTTIADGTAATAVTLRTLINHLNNIIPTPAPSTLPVLALGGLVATRRRRC